MDKIVTKCKIENKETNKGIKADELWIVFFNEKLEVEKIMSKILEMIEKRNKAWEGAKVFLESKRDKVDLISEEDALVYDEMEKKVHNFSLEIEHLKKIEELDKELSKPMSDAIVN